MNQTCLNSSFLVHWDIELLTWTILNQMSVRVYWITELISRTVWTFQSKPWSKSFRFCKPVEPNWKTKIIRLYMNEWVADSKTAQVDLVWFVIEQTWFCEPVSKNDSKEWFVHCYVKKQDPPHIVKRYKMQLFNWRSVNKSLPLDAISNKYLWANNEEIRGCSARSVSVPWFGLWNTAWNPWAEPLAPRRLSGPEQIHSTTVMPLCSIPMLLRGFGH